LTVISQLYNFVVQFPEAVQFVQDEEGRPTSGDATRLAGGAFQGEYGETYFHRLQHIRNIHMFMGLPVHFVHGALNFLHLQLSQLIESQVEPKLKEASYLALEKILDLNRDILTHTAHSVDELHKNLYYRVEHSLLRFTRRLIFGFDLLLLLGLIGLSLGAVFLIGSDISKIFHADDHGKSVLGVLGSLLVLWMTHRTDGGGTGPYQRRRLQLHLFVGAAMVALFANSVGQYEFRKFTGGKFLSGQYPGPGINFLALQRKDRRKRPCPNSVQNCQGSNRPEAQRRDGVTSQKGLF
jgi:hypothetical protein